MMKPIKLLSLAACATLVLASCGDDDDDAADEAPAATTEAPAATTTEAPATTAAATTTPATTEAPATTAAMESADDSATATTAAADPYCAFALEVAAQETPPSADQLNQLVELAPPEIADAANIAGPALAAAGDDMVAFFTAYAQDDVEQAIEQINAFEDANCGTDHGTNEPPEGASREIEPDAARVDVVASDYMFDMPDAIDAGRTSFVLTNSGHEAHFLEIVKMAEGHTIAEALEAEDASEMIAGDWSTGLAAPDGVDDEAITFD